MFPEHSETSTIDYMTLNKLKCFGEKKKSTLEFLYQRLENNNKDQKKKL